MTQFENQTKHDVPVIRHILQGLILSYCFGWGVLVLNVGSVPLLDNRWWQISSAICISTTIWLAITLTLRTLVWWTATVMTVVTVRSFAYFSDGILNPFGVWLLVLSGVTVTGLAVISINALTGRLGALKT